MSKELAGGAGKGAPGRGQEQGQVQGRASGDAAMTTEDQADEADDTVGMVETRDPTSRPVYKLSVRLIDTYKHINKVYYEAKAKRLREQADVTRGGVFNDGYDDQHYDYILQSNIDEIFAERYILKHRIGKGSFGQVVCAYDKQDQCEVAIKIIKSRKPFMVQAQTEIELLNLMNERDDRGDFNVVKLLNKFVFRNHQCLVFEMLSYNLYELLKNTKFRGVSLNLIRKFARQILKALEFLASPEVDVVHCDLKPENILLRHPRRSAIKLIDFGSSCLRERRTYTYIQSRFYRSPEILLGLTYDQKIDMWSLGCVLVEMHTGEPLFGGTDQADQMCRIVDVLGMPPVEMLDASPIQVRSQFFELIETGSGAAPSPECDPSRTVAKENGSGYYILKRVVRPDAPAPRTLAEIVGVTTGGPFGRRRGEQDHSEENYLEFLDFVMQMLIFSPQHRASAAHALSHPYLHGGAEARGPRGGEGSDQGSISISSRADRATKVAGGPIGGGAMAGGAAGGAAGGVGGVGVDAVGGAEGGGGGGGGVGAGYAKAGMGGGSGAEEGDASGEQLQRGRSTEAQYAAGIRSRSAPSVRLNSRPILAEEAAAMAVSSSSSAVGLGLGWGAQGSGGIGGGLGSGGGGLNGGGGGGGEAYGGGAYGAAVAMMQSGYQPQQGMVAYDQRGAFPGYPGQGSFDSGIGGATGNASYGGKAGGAYGSGGGISATQQQQQQQGPAVGGYGSGYEQPTQHSSAGQHYLMQAPGQGQGSGQALGPRQSLGYGQDPGQGVGYGQFHGQGAVGYGQGYGGDAGAPVVGDSMAIDVGDSGAHASGVRAALADLSLRGYGSAAIDHDEQALAHAALAGGGASRAGPYSCDTAPSGQSLQGGPGLQGPPGGPGSQYAQKVGMGKQPPYPPLVAGSSTAVPRDDEAAALQALESGRGGGGNAAAGRDQGHRRP